MDGWTRLYAKATESEHLTEVLDKDADAFALFLLMMANAGVWGRFPANPKLLKARVAPLSDRLTTQRIAEVLPILEDPPRGELAGLVQRYPADDRGIECVAITKHLTYNPQQQWHKVGRPKFPPPPDWQPPPSLLVYLEKVRQGRFRDKDFAQECVRFGLRPDEILKSETVVPPDETEPAPQAELHLAEEAKEPVRETLAPEPEAPRPEPPPKRQRRVAATDAQAADHTGLYDALEAAYPHYRDARLRGLLAVYLGLLSQPGCSVNEAQLVAALKRDPPLAGSSPDRYMLHAQHISRDSPDEGETPTRPQFTPAQVAEMEEKQDAKVRAELQEARLKRLAEYGIKPEVDELWQETQKLLRERGSWSVGLSMCWLQSVTEGVATMLMPATARRRLAPLEAEIVAALQAVTGGPVTLEIQEIVTQARTDARQAEAIEQARSYVDDCEAYADDPAALSDALKEMFGPDLARIAAQTVTGAAGSSEDQ